MGTRPTSRLLPAVTWFSPPISPRTREERHILRAVREPPLPCMLRTRGPGGERLGKSGGAGRCCGVCISRVAVRS